MKIGVNYSKGSVALLERGEAEFDVFKCPAWSDLVVEAQAVAPVYVHMPLRTGAGTGHVLDTETNEPVVWEKIERFLETTETPYVNLHLDMRASEADDPSSRDEVIERLLIDVQSVTEKFGADKVIGENVYDFRGGGARPCFSADVIAEVIREAGCGFLFDISHAQVKAHRDGVSFEQFVSRLPTERIWEIHVSGVQKVDARWEKVFSGVDPALGARLAGKWQDHLPITDDDWAVLESVYKRIGSGEWSTPWVSALENGGAGNLFGALTFEDCLREEIAGLNRLRDKKLGLVRK